MPEKGESDMGLFSCRLLRRSRNWCDLRPPPRLPGATGERNFLPFIPWMAQRGTVRTFPAAHAMEAVGINTPRGSGRGLGVAARTPELMPTLSIVIPAYNEERFIGELLEQVRAVDLGALGVDKEIIVVDDCSTDRTSAIAGGVARRAAPSTADERRQRRGPCARGSPSRPATT